MADRALKRHNNIDDAALTDFSPKMLPKLQEPFFLEMELNNIGKTCILHLYLENEYSENSFSTIGIDFKTKYFKFDDKIVDENNEHEFSFTSELKKSLENKGNENIMIYLDKIILIIIFIVINVSIFLMKRL